MQTNLRDLEAIVAQCTKSLDSVDQVTRHAHAQLVGHLLASTQIERVIPTPEVSQKGKKDQGSEQHADDISSSIHAAAEITKPMLAVNDMLSLLSVQFHQYHGSRKTRIGNVKTPMMTKGNPWTQVFRRSQKQMIADALPHDGVHSFSL